MSVQLTMEFGELVVHEEISTPYHAAEFLRHHVEDSTDYGFHHVHRKSQHNLELHPFPTDLDVVVEPPKNVKLTGRTLSFGVTREVIDFEELDRREPVFDVDHTVDYSWAHHHLKPHFSVIDFREDD